MKDDQRYFFYNVSKPRLFFRLGLLAMLVMSVIFAGAMITFRVNKGVHWHIVNTYQDEIFTADVALYKMKTLFENDAERFSTAQNLIYKGFFSEIYGKNGVKMMKDLADSGYAPAQTYFGDMLMISIELPYHQEQARYYYALAAMQHYQPAHQKLIAARDP